MIPHARLQALLPALTCSFPFHSAVVGSQLSDTHDATTRAGKGASSGVGFAIPIDTAKGLVEQVLKYGKVVRPVLGITIAPPQTVRQIGIEGVLVLEVPSGGPADRAGIKGTYRWAARPPPLCPKYCPKLLAILILLVC